MKMDRIERSRNAARISVSLAAELAQGLDEMVSTRGYPNRSKAIAEMIQEALITHHQAKSEGLMAGTITLIYDAEKPGLLQQLAQLLGYAVLQSLECRQPFPVASRGGLVFSCLVQLVTRRCHCRDVGETLWRPALYTAFFQGKLDIQQFREYVLGFLALFG